MDEQTTNVLAYFAERERRPSFAPVGMAIVAATFAVLVVGEMFGMAWGAAGGFLVIGTASRANSRKKRSADATLRLDDGRLIVADSHGGIRIDVPLKELEDVVLDTKSVQRFREDTAGGFPDIRAVHTRVGDSFDNSRIVLVTANISVELTERYTSSIDATEWLTRIRRFLRSNGWTPREER